MGVINSFAGGLFFAMAFIHTIPEAQEKFNEYFEGRIKHEKFPFAFFFATMSYLLILVLEKIVFDTHSLLDVHVHPYNHNHGQPNEKNYESLEMP